jgi:cytochrome c oxidase cbb3-type subunit IV
MRLVSHYFESISGIAIYPIISFLIFFFFFLAVTYLVIKMDKQRVEEMANMPLDQDFEAENIPERKL